MGKFDWKRGIEYASEGLRENRDRKRAYERADEENAMTISRLLAEQGMPVPEPLMKMLSTKYPITSQLMPGLDKAIREGKQSQLEQDLMKKYQYEMIESQFREPPKPTGRAATMLQIENEPWYQALSPEEQIKIRQKVLMGGGGLDEINQSLAEMRLQTGGMQQQLLDWQLKMKPTEERLKSLEEEKKTFDITQAKAEAAKIKKPEEAFALISDSIENVYNNWSTIPKEKKGKWTNVWYKAQEQMGAETLPDDPNYGPYYVSKTGLAVDLATQWEPKKGGGVQMLTQPDIERYTSLIPTLATTDEAAGWKRKEELKKILSRKMGIEYKMKDYPGGSTSDKASINKDKAYLDKLKREKEAQMGVR